MKPTSVSAGLQDAYPHHTAVDTATPSCEPRCTPMSPLARQQMHSSAGAAAATGHSIHTQARWGFTVLSAFFVPGDLDL